MGESEKRLWLFPSHKLTLGNGHGSKAKSHSEHPNPTTQMETKMGGEFAYQPKWDPIGFDSHQPFEGRGLGS